MSKQSYGITILDNHPMSDITESELNGWNVKEILFGHQTSELNYTFDNFSDWLLAKVLLEQQHSDIEFTTWQPSETLPNPWPNGKYTQREYDVALFNRYNTPTNLQGFLNTHGVLDRQRITSGFILSNCSQFKEMKEAIQKEYPDHSVTYLKTILIQHPDDCGVAGIVYMPYVMGTNVYC